MVEVLSVSRSNLTLRKSKDDLLLPTIRHLVDARPTYGYLSAYWRLLGIANRPRDSCVGEQGTVFRRPGARLTASESHRIMQVYALVLERYTGLPHSQIYDSKVVVMRSNLRWRSVGLELSF